MNTNPSPKHPLVSIGIVNWNCGEFLPACLEAVAKQDYPSLEVILLDNASTDGSLAPVERDFPSVTIIRNPTNVGFGNAHNKIIHASHGQYYMPLNPDAELSPDFVTQMVGALETHHDFGYATGLVYFTTHDPSLQNLVFSAGHLFVRSCHTYNRLHVNRVPPEKFTEGEVGGACGVCPLYRRIMLDDISVDGEFFDRNFFMYVEDIDLDWRAHLAGWRCWFTPKAIAWHVMEGTGGADMPPIRAQGALNRWLMILKNSSPRLTLRLLPFILKFDLTVILPLIARKPTTFLHLWSGIFGKIRSTLRKGRIIRKRRRWGDEQILDWMESNRCELVRCGREGTEKIIIKKREGRFVRR